MSVRVAAVGGCRSETVETHRRTLTVLLETSVAQCTLGPTR